MEALLVSLTAGLAFLAYATRLAFELRGDERSLRRARLAWTIAVAGLFVHVALAFHFVHGWSHAHAVEHTAELTERVTGWRFGGGVWANYGILAWSAIDLVLWFARGPEFPRRRVRYSRILHGVLIFLWVNATVVFGPSYWWAFLPVIVVVVGLCGRRSFKMRKNSDSWE